MIRDFYPTRFVAAFLCGVSGLACAAEIQVLGLMTGKAVVQIDGGKQRMMSVGETAPDGIKLISANSQQAVFEIDGKRQTLTTGGTGRFAGGGSTERQTASLTNNGQGHFLTTGAINGAAVQFLVDTGATSIAMSQEEAKRIGISYLSGQKSIVMTANGPVQSYRVKLDSVRVGDIVLSNVDAMVVPASMNVVLLGMSFLNRTEMKRDGDLMTLTRKF
jgi:aspartyl protease family protein